VSSPIASHSGVIVATVFRPSPFRHRFPQLRALQAQLCPADPPGRMRNR
jgi:hypothetical protein